MIAYAMYQPGVTVYLPHDVSSSSSSFRLADESTHMWDLMADSVQFPFDLCVSLRIVEPMRRHPGDPEDPKVLDLQTQWQMARTIVAIAANSSDWHVRRMQYICLSMASMSTRGRRRSGA